LLHFENQPGRMRNAGGQNQFRHDVFLSIWYVSELFADFLTPQKFCVNEVRPSVDGFSSTNHTIGLNSIGA
jgi:hypothetical protein